MYYYGMYRLGQIPFPSPFLPFPLLLFVSSMLHGMPSCDCLGIIGSFGRGLVGVGGHTYHLKNICDQVFGVGSYLC